MEYYASQDCAIQKGKTEVGAPTHRGLRLDRTRFPHATLLSTNSPDDDRFNCEGTIPRAFRPRLSDLLPQVQPEEGQPGRRAPAPGPEVSFSLRPLDEPEATLHLGASPRDAANYRVIGLARFDCKRVEELLATHSRLRPEHWSGPVDFYGLITRETQAFVKRLPWALSLTVAEGIGPGAPIVLSERFRRAEDGIWKSFLKPECRAVVTKGVAGCGKSALVRALAQEMREMKVPSRLQGHLIASLSTALFMPSGSALEEVEKSAARAEMATRRAIWVIDEASRLVERGNTAALDNLLLFIDQGARVVLLSDQSYLIEKREAFMRRLSAVYLAPAEGQEVFDIADSLARHLGEQTGLTIRPEAVQEAVTLSSGSTFAQPHAAVNLLSGAVAGAEARGEQEVTATSVERELQEMSTQGSAPPRLPRTVDEFIELVRAEGFRGHEGFLQDFGRHVLRDLRQRFRPDRPGPISSCVVAGPRGTGKKKLLRSVGKIATGHERKVLEINCSSFSQAHDIQTFRGSPPSYVGFGEPCVLDFVKQTPDGVLIFDKPELGHPNLLKLIDEILEGSVTKGDGQRISTRGLMVFISSGLGGDCGRAKIGFNPEETPSQRRHCDALEKALGGALISRIGWRNIFSMGALEPAALRNILRLRVHSFAKKEGVRVSVEEPVFEHIVSRCNWNDEGARAVLNEYSQVLEPVLEGEVKRGLARGEAERLHVFLDAKGEIACRVEPTGGQPDQGSGSEPQGGSHGE